MSKNPTKKKRAVVASEDIPENTWLGRSGGRGGKTLFRAILRKKFTGGDEVLRTFGTIEAAKAWLWERETDRSALAGKELSIGEVIECKRALGRLRPDGHTITAAVDYYYARGPGGRKPMILSAAIELRLAALSKSKRKANYIKAQRIAGEVLLATAGDHSVFHYTPAVLVRWLDEQTEARKWGAGSIYNYHRDVSLIFGFLVRHKLVPENPLKDPAFDYVKEIKKDADHNRIVQIYTPDECLKLLRAAMEMPHLRLLPRLIFQFFSGMRVEEVRKDSWPIVEVLNRRINLGIHDVAKNGQPRPIPFSDAFAAWLALIPEPERIGRIVDETNLRHRLDKLHERAGVEKKVNGPRHTFASHDYVSHGDADQTRKKLGHVDDETLFKHYIKDVSPQQAAAFLALRPPLDVVPDAPPGDWRSKRRSPRRPSAAQIEAGFEAVHAGKLSRLALPSLFTKHATYVTAHTALWHHGIIEQVPTAIYAATTGEAATFQTPFGPVHLHQIAPELFGGWGTNERCPGAQIATAEKALTDYFYMANSRDPAFGKLPEMEVPPGFNWKAAHGFADLIANPVWKKTVHTRLTEQEKECRLLAAHDSAEA